MHADLGFLSPAGARNQTNNLLIIGRPRSLLSQFNGPGQNVLLKSLCLIGRVPIPAPQLSAGVNQYLDRWF